MRRARLVIVTWIAIALMPVLAACDPTPQVAIVSADNSKRAAVKVEIADTPDARELGLMYRNHLDEDVGMLFVFPSPSDTHFWMKNTVIPLDMIFADAHGKVVGIVANAKPYSEAMVGGFDGTRYVLEVNGGYAARHRIVAGDRLEFRGFSPHTAR
jgi:uncharacterized membrane protein (UPF0127 family)